MSQKGYIASRKPKNPQQHPLIPIIRAPNEFPMIMSTQTKRISSDPNIPTSRLGQSGAAHPVDVTKWVFDLDNGPQKPPSPHTRHTQPFYITPLRLKQKPHKQSTHEPTKSLQRDLLRIPRFESCGQIYTYIW